MDTEHADIVVHATPFGPSYKYHPRLLSIVAYAVILAVLIQKIVNLQDVLHDFFVLGPSLLAAFSIAMLTENKFRISLGLD